MKSQVEDLKTTLKINKDLFFKNINQDKNNEDTLLSQMRAENARISRKIDEMFEEKTLIEKNMMLTVSNCLIKTTILMSLKG